MDASPIPSFTHRKIKQTSSNRLVLLDPHFEVWYDKNSMVDGDALLATIRKTLSETDFGVAVFSPSYFGKKWPQDELGGLYALETTHPTHTGKR